MSLKKLSLVVLCLLLCTGCGGGWVRLYNGTPNFNFVPKTTERIGVAVRDQRPYVLNKDKTEAFVGLQRNQYGIPRSLVTRSGNPLADRYREMIVYAYDERGADVISVPALPTNSLAEVAQNAKEKEVKRVMVFDLKEWKTDRWTAAKLYYDVTLHVLDAEDSSGTPLYSKTVKGEDEVEEKDFYQKIGKILDQVADTPKARAALMMKGSVADAPVLSKGTPKPEPVKEVASADGKDNCSTEQILKMKEMGMSDTQVKAACPG